MMIVAIFYKISNNNMNYNKLNKMSNKYKIYNLHYQNNNSKVVNQNNLFQVNKLDKLKFIIHKMKINYN